jgi:hypothetical protein
MDERMKAEKGHRVTLAQGALAIPDELAEVQSGKYLFTVHNAGKLRSVTALSNALWAAGDGRAILLGGHGGHG